MLVMVLMLRGFVRTALFRGLQTGVDGTGVRSTIVKNLKKHKKHMKNTKNINTQTRKQKTQTNINNITKHNNTQKNQTPVASTPI